MTYHNPILGKFRVPPDPEVAKRIDGFYKTIGWEVQPSTATSALNRTYVNPKVPTGGNPPTLVYEQIENPDDQTPFFVNEEAKPSSYARGLRLPNMPALIEVHLIVPSEKDVHTIFARGGELLKSHTDVWPRTRAGSQEFQMRDPFNYPFWIATDPGWEIQAPQPNASPFVTHIQREDSRRSIAVITRQNLRDFAEANQRTAAFGERLFNVLDRASRSDETYINNRDFTPYVEYNAHGRLLGLKPQAIKQLLEDIGQSQIDIYNFGDTGRELLANLHSELYPGETTES